MSTRTQSLLQIFVLATLLASASYAAEPAKKGKALDIAMTQFKKHRTEITTLSMECVYFMDDTDKVGDHLEDVTVREKHSAKCGGDPKIEPTLAILRVDTKAGKASLYDVVENKYLPLK